MFATAVLDGPRPARKWTSNAMITHDLLEMASFLAFAPPRTARTNPHYSRTTPHAHSLTPAPPFSYAKLHLLYLRHSHVPIPPLEDA